MFGDILKKLRMDAGLTQEELATKFNIIDTAISKYETLIIVVYKKAIFTKLGDLYCT